MDREFSFNEMTDPILFENIENKHAEYITVNLFDTQPQTAANYGIFFIARHGCEVIHISEVHGTAGTDAGAVTLQIEKLTGVTAKGAGINLLNTSFNLKATANSVQTRDASTTFDFVRDITTSPPILNVGDRLAIKSSGVLTNLRDLQVTIYLKPLGRGHYR